MKLFDVYPLYEVNLTKASGCYVYDEQGRKYLDLYGGHAVISIGHAHPKYIEALSEQLKRIGFYSNFVKNTLQEELAETLGAVSGYPDYALFLSNSGAEANENALKLASFHTGKKKILAFRKAFHGRTSGTVAVTDNPSISAPYNSTGNVAFVEMNDVQAVENELASGDYAAAIIEGIQGVAGIIAPDEGFLKQLREICTRHKVLLILDEIQSGYGRTGKFFAHQWEEIRPDLITVAKGMGNGFPVGGTLIAPEIEARYGMLGTTFGGNHLACAASLAVLKIMSEEKLIDNALQTGEDALNALRALSGIDEVRGRGLMIGIEMPVAVAEMRRKLLFEHGIFTGGAGNNIIRLLPPLCVGKEEMNLFVNTFKNIII
ncbi:MAG: aspartate aminotransferase family protein [Prevotellaceae bacterium]|jgi:acetylornithine aminotransferase|nr:aspartate aminotransferase family protein [Prevotellaceae bacterium]